MPYHVHRDPDADDGHWSDEGLHECARDTRCTDPRIITIGKKTTRLPALTPRAFCDADATVITRALRELPARWYEVWHGLGTKAQANGPKVAISKSAPIPLSLPADELLRDVVHVLASWEERVADAANLHTRGTWEASRRRAHLQVIGAVRILAAHVTTLLSLPEQPMMRAVSLREAATLPAGTRGLVHAGAQYADVILHLGGTHAGLEVLQFHYRCRRLLGETPPAERRLHGVACDCGFAELRELLTDDGEPDGARCYECGNEYTATTYAQLVDGQAQDTKTAGYRRRTVWPEAGDDLEARRA